MKFPIVNNEIDLTSLLRNGLPTIQLFNENLLDNAYPSLNLIT